MNAQAYPLHWPPGFPRAKARDVVRLATGIPLRPACRAQRGYLSVSLWENGMGKTWFVHQIVALTFLGPRPPGHDAAHRDGNKHNNHRSNIVWKTRAENERDKIVHGTSNRGERNGMSRQAKERRCR